MELKRIKTLETEYIIIYLIDAIHMINELVLLMMTGVVFLTSRSKQLTLYTGTPSLLPMPILTKHPFMTFLKNGMWHHISSLCRDTLTSSSSSLVCMNLIGSLCLRVGDFSSSSESLLLMWEWKKIRKQVTNSEIHMYCIPLFYTTSYCIALATAYRR